MRLTAEARNGSESTYKMVCTKALKKKGESEGHYRQFLHEITYPQIISHLGSKNSVEQKLRAMIKQKMDKRETTVM